MTNDQWLKRWVISSLGCVVGVLILIACGDPQSAALKELSAQGYSLSVPEFLRAARAGDADAVRGFVAAGMEPNLADTSGMTALEAAISAGKLEAAEALLACGAVVPAGKGHAFLLAAVRSRSLPVLELLMGRGVRPDEKTEESPLVLAAEQSQSAMIEALLPHCGKDVQRAVLAAAAGGDVAVLSRLVRAGGSLWKPDEDTRRTPLMIAAGKGREAAVDLMLASGVDAFQVDAERLCALEHAQAGGFADIAKKLSAIPKQEEVADRLTGASVRTRGDAAQALALGRLVYVRCTQVALPFSLESLEGNQATLRLRADERLLVLVEGQLIPGTRWQVGPRKVVPPFTGLLLQREGESAGNDACWLLPKQPARGGGLCAVLRDSADGHLYEAEPGDLFSLTGSSTLELIVQEVAALKVILSEASGAGSTWVLDLGGRRL